MNQEAARSLNEYRIAQEAGRLQWTFDQVAQTPVDIVLLCRRLGWIGQAGYERLQNTPGRAVRDWLVIAAMEREIEEAKRVNSR